MGDAFSTGRSLLKRRSLTVSFIFAFGKWLSQWLRAT